MKKNKTFIIMLMIVSLLSGCGSKIQLPENPMVYESGVNEELEYAYLAYEDKIYIPYCPYETKYLGDCIGYCDIPEDENAEGGKVYICEMKGYSSEEWIIEISDTNCTEGMIYREINTTNIPEGLSSEYEWNN